MPAILAKKLAAKVAETLVDPHDYFEVPIAAPRGLVHPDFAARAIVSGARRSATLRWTYQAETGPVTAWFALGGVTRALAWIDCMGRR